MLSSPPLRSKPLAELEAKQDQILRELDELDRRVEIALREFLVVRAPDPASPAMSLV